MGSVFRTCFILHLSHPQSSSKLKLLVPSINVWDNRGHGKRIKRGIDRSCIKSDNEQGKRRGRVTKDRKDHDELVLSKGPTFQVEYLAKWPHPICYSPLKLDSQPKPNLRYSSIGLLGCSASAIMSDILNPY